MTQAVLNARARLEGFKGRTLKLDLTRGKPSPEQLDLSNALLSAPGEAGYRSESGIDCRNYGDLLGLPEARKLFGEVLEVPTQNVLVGGNSSLALMHDTLMRAMLFGVAGGDGPWSRAETIKFLCPVPGYDRHFSICALLGIEMVPVPLTGSGPDMESVARLAREDSSIKGIWCVPKYSNPTGEVYSAEVVSALASLKAGAKDFRIFWDAAYQVHHLYDDRPQVRNLLTACQDAGTPDRPLLFGSTSKITFAGGGVAFMAASSANLAQAAQLMSCQTIGHDKLNQLRHVRFFGDFSGIERHMHRHAAIMRPKFDAVQEVLARELSATALASWTHPRGGYFVSTDTLPGCAKDVVALAGEAGVKLTPAGSTHPLGKDPEDKNIRLAPSFPSVEEVRLATEVLAVCIHVVCGQKRAA